MDPRDFGFLIKTLLDAQGYDDVEVTQFSGDRGIDLIATLSSGGISKIKTVVQAKRTPAVGLPIVQRLRGTLAKVNAGAGLLVTSGTFSPEARKDVVDVPLPPISLIGGQQLVQLLMKNNIGVRPSPLTLYSLALEDLTMQREQTENNEP
jgi:restriction system protein